MTKKIDFLFVIHCHQPVGNFEFVFEESYQKSYLPLLETVQRHPLIKMTLHISGALFDWIRQKHPEYMEMLKQMCDSGQVELMGGGFYEPILVILDDSDKTGQIRRLSDFVETNFGQKPKGLWLAERVWEPYLAKPITEAGMEYVILDDYHFRRAGVASEKISGYFLTEEQGNILKVIPGSETLRYLIPFHSARESVDYMKKVWKENRFKCIAMADDGEKFGVWPGTYELVYEKKWLSGFFKLLEENLDWINPATCSEYIGNNSPEGTTYFPTCSYREMEEWILPLHRYRKLNKTVKGGSAPTAIGELTMGGLWRGFLAKYPESNRMHKKTLCLSRKLSKLKGAAEKILSDAADSRSEKEKSGIKTIIAEATDNIWQAQCNDAYWHGVFGGLYLPHMCSYIYKNLVSAETKIETLVVKLGLDKLCPEYSASPLIFRGDFNFDLEDEFLINTRRLFLYCNPRDGGRLYECGFKPKAFNIMATLARRPEHYHDMLTESNGINTSEGTTTIHDGIRAKEEGLEALLFFDSGERNSLKEHFFAPDVTLEQFSSNKYHEHGDFLHGEFLGTVSQDATSLMLERSGFVGGLSLELKKQISIVGTEETIKIDYVLKNTSSGFITTSFGVEFNINLLAGNAHDRFYKIDKQKIENGNLSSIGVSENSKSISLVDEWMGLSVSLASDKAFGLWRFPVETVSSSETGLEKVYQSSCVLPHWNLTLNPDDTFGVSFEFSVMEL